MTTETIDEVSKLNFLINQISKTEFFFEQISTTYISKNFGPNFLLESLSLFELCLLFYKMKKYIISDSLLYVSEPQTDLKLDTEEKEVLSLFSYKLAKVNVAENNTIDFRKQIKSLLEKMRTRKPGSNFNRGLQESLLRCGKRIGLIRKLPIVMAEEDKLMRTYTAKYRVAEALYLTRPVIYCFCQIFFGQRSYKPYLISLLIDLVRLILESRVKFRTTAELNEFKKRNRDLIINYLLRNPFYIEILRNRILDPLLDKLFPRFTFIKKIIIYIFEIRSSLSILM